MSPWNSGVLALNTQGKIHLRSFKWAHVSLGPSLSAKVKPVSLWNRGPSPFLPPPPDSLGLVRSRSVLGVLRLRKSPGQNRPVQNPDLTGTCAGEIPPIFRNVGPGGSKQWAQRFPTSPEPTPHRGGHQAGLQKRKACPQENTGQEGGH